MTATERKRPLPSAMSSDLHCLQCPCALLISTAFDYVLCPSMMSLSTFDRVILKSFPEEVDEEARDECYLSGQRSER